MYCISLTKITKVLFSNRSSPRKERAPLCLKECMDAPTEPRQRCRRRAILMFIIIFGVLSYILNHKVSHNVQLTPMKYMDDIDLSLLDIKDTVKKIPRRNSTVTTVRNLTKSITFNNKYVEEAMQNGTRTLVVDLTSIYKKATTIPIKITNKLQMCTIDMKKYNIEVIVNKEKPLLNFHKDYSMVRQGGFYRPDDCEPRHKVGILVPYRDRETNLAAFMFTMHPFLMKQKLEYRIFIIEQAGKESFNRGRIFNAGFKEMLKYGDWHCVVFHDVDLLPLDDKILYTCPSFPRHMCASVVEKEGLPYYKYHTLFGGVASMSIEDYKKVNGYSNRYWGWGGEDNDMFWRLRASHLPIVRYNKSVARYTSLPHSKQPENPNRYRLLHDATERFKTDGLSDLVYKVISTKLRHLYTHIIVDINPLKENISNINNSIGKLKSL